MDYKINRLVRWVCRDGGIQLIWPNGDDYVVEVASADNAKGVVGLLEDFAGNIVSEQVFLDALAAAGADEAEGLLSALVKCGALTSKAAGGAKVARAFHSLMQRQDVFCGLSHDEVRDLLSDAHQDTGAAYQKLPQPDKLPNLQELLLETGSSHVTVSDPISDEDIATLLALAYGRNQDPPPGTDPTKYTGTTASAGAFFPLRLIVQTKDTIESEQPHALCYIRDTHAFERLEIRPYSAVSVGNMAQFMSDYGSFMMLSIMFDLTWSEIKYGNHAYRFALLEAGAVMQNLRFVSPRLGLRNCPCGFSLEPWIRANIPSCKTYMHAVTIGFGKDPES